MMMIKSLLFRISMPIVDKYMSSDLSIRFLNRLWRKITISHMNFLDKSFRNALKALVNEEIKNK